MSCNATLVTKKVVDKLINSGLNNISISLDGTREINDYIRGEGVYDKVLSTCNFFKILNYQEW
mgnify:CR=1 FL=1